MKEILPDDAWSPEGAVNQYREEAATRCAPIDARLDFLEKEYAALTLEYNQIKDTPIPWGFFSSFKIKKKLKNLTYRMWMNRRLLTIMYEKRIAYS